MDCCAILWNNHKPTRIHIKRSFGWCLEFGISFLVCFGEAIGGLKRFLFLNWKWWPNYTLNALNVPTIGGRRQSIAVELESKTPHIFRLPLKLLEQVRSGPANKKIVQDEAGIWSWAQSPSKTFPENGFGKRCRRTCFYKIKRLFQIKFLQD